MKMNGKNIRQRFRDMRFQTRLLSVSIIVWVLPVFIAQIVFVNVSIQNLNHQIDKLTRSTLTQISERFSLTIESYMDIAYQIYADGNIVKNLTEYHEAEDVERAALFFSMNERIKQITEAKGGIRCISLICSSGESITYDKQTGSALDNLWRRYKDLRMITPYRMTQGKKGITLIPTQTMWDDGEQTALFFIGKEIYNAENLDRGTVATVIIGIREDVLREICSEDEAMQDNSVNFIVDAEGKIVSFPDVSYIGTQVSGKQTACELVQETGMFRGKNLGSSSYTDAGTGWTFYNVYDYDYMMRPVSSMQSVYLVLLLLDVILMIVFIHYTSRSFTVDLNRIMDGIRQVEKGNLDVRLAVDREDEFGQIGKHFNIMTQKVQSLIQEVQDISEKKSQAEIKALESQINPHFLYNTLDAINWMAIGKGEYEIGEMISNLGLILRYTMNQSNGMARIFEVEEWLKSYVALYQLRYNHSFTFQIYVEPGVRDVKIYKLLLQPILENAILHGLKGIEDGFIRVDIGYVDSREKIYLVVEDNGVGMEEEQVRYYNQYRGEKSTDEGIGLVNVFERILLYYGKEGSWHINSVKGRGTIIEVTFPVLEDTEEQGL